MKRAARLGKIGAAGAAFALAVGIGSGVQADSTAPEPIAGLLERAGYACQELERAELRDVDRSGALYRVRCDGSLRYAMLIKPDGTTTVVAESPTRHIRSN